MNTGFPAGESTKKVIGLAPHHRVSQQSFPCPMPPAVHETLGRHRHQFKDQNAAVRSPWTRGHPLVPFEFFPVGYRVVAGRLQDATGHTSERADVHARMDGSMHLCMNVCMYLSVYLCTWRAEVVRPRASTVLSTEGAFFSKNRLKIERHQFCSCARKHSRARILVDTFFTQIFLGTRYFVVANPAVTDDWPTRVESKKRVGVSYFFFVSALRTNPCSSTRVGDID